MLTSRSRCLGFGLVVAAIVALGAADARAQQRDEPSAGEREGPPRPLSEAPPAPSTDEPAPPPAAIESPPPVPAVEPPAPVRAVAPAAPPAAPPAASGTVRFGAPGQLVISADSVIGVASTEYSASAAKFSSAVLSPGADYFIVRGFSIGVGLTLAYSYARGYGADSSLVETTTTTVAGGPRLGLNVPLGDFFSFYPRVNLGIESVHRELRLSAGRSLSVSGNPLGAPSTTTTGPYASVFMPLLVHPKPHFFLGAGPGLSHNFGRAHVDPSVGGESTSWFGRVVLGGWWGGVEADPPAPASPAPTLAQRFGEQGQWVITGQVGAAISRTTFGGADAPRTSASLTPGFDCFVVSHVSLGLGLGGSYSHIVGRQPDGSTVESKGTGLGAFGRVGADLPLGSSFSWYPRASIGIAKESIEQTSGPYQNKHSDTVVRIGLYAPVLVHVASHLFVGFGPYVSREVKRTADVEDQRPENLGTSIGADLMVGGWL